MGTKIGFLIVIIGDSLGSSQVLKPNTPISPTSLHKLRKVHQRIGIRLSLLEMDGIYIITKLPNSSKIDLGFSIIGRKTSGYGNVTIFVGEYAVLSIDRPGGVDWSGGVGRLKYPTIVSAIGEAVFWDCYGTESFCCDAQQLRAVAAELEWVSVDA